LKYFNGAFTEPGLGGDSSPIDPSGQLARAWVTYSTALKSFIGFSRVSRQDADPSAGSAGFGLTFSTDGVNGWSALPNLVLESSGPWAGRTESSGELIEYPSMVSLEGSSEFVGDTFWIYSMYLQAGQPLEHNRYLLRRRISLTPAAGLSPTEMVPRITLATYELGKDSWTTTTVTSTDYALVDTLGALYTDRVPNSAPLYDCYLPVQGDHMLSSERNCEGPMAFYQGRLGWIAQYPFEGATQIFRCYEPARARHFVSRDPTCAGATSEFPLGWLAQAPQFAQP
jgi:hypothetical protein